MNRQNVDVESIEINFPSNKFNLGFTFQDTPGVDSNVATHQSSTEQFMYTSNLLFYTVDYNHVQSALNFKFMKRINEAGIPIVFVINQIDKHNEEEITFETFKSRVEKSIKDWDIKLQDTYYVSKFDHPQNEIDKLSNFLVFMDQHRESTKTMLIEPFNSLPMHNTHTFKMKCNLFLTPFKLMKINSRRHIFNFNKIKKSAQKHNCSMILINYLII